MLKARLFNIQKYSIYDGPGIRTLVFFAGCPLRCLWCSNPEGQRGTSLLFSRAACVSCGACVPVCPVGRHVLAGDPLRHEMLGERPCSGCGACVRTCPSRALTLTGQERTLDEVLEVVLEDSIFYETSGGGVTVGGGEPLGQWRFAAELLRRCRQEGLNTAMETSGCAPEEHVAAVAPYVDLFLYDIKMTDSEVHRRLTGLGSELILFNLAMLLSQGSRVRVRMPLIGGCNAYMEEMEARAAFLRPWKDRPNLLGVDLLPYHKLGVGKYVQLGLDYDLGAEAAVNEDFLAGARELFAREGYDVAIVRH